MAQWFIGTWVWPDPRTTGHFGDDAVVSVAPGNVYRTWYLTELELWHLKSSSNGKLKSSM